MLNSFYYRCIRTILGISNRQQWEERISKVEVRKKEMGRSRDGERHGD